MRKFLTLIVVAAAVLWAGVARAGAHPPVPTVALVKVTPDGVVTVTVIHDALAFALNDTSVRVGDPAMYALLDAPESEMAAAFEDGLARLKVSLRMATDGAPLPFEVVEAPSVESVKLWLKEHRSRRLPCKMDFVVRAQLPPGAKGLTFRFPEILSDTLIVIDRPDMEPSQLPVLPAEVSPPFDVHMAAPPPPAGGVAPPVPDAVSATSQEPVKDVGVFGVFWRFVVIGFKHIIPQGLDHVCFVLGLFLLTPRAKPVLLQITAFTIAHTLTLTLTTLHIVGLPGHIVEPVIALSIVFIGVENLVTKEVSRWRMAVAFLFGLVHGMGVATAFSEVPVSQGRLLSSLAAFTVGVEAGHLAVLAAAFLVLGWFRDKPWYRSRITIPLSCLIAVMALIWTVQRVWPSGEGEAAAATLVQVERERSEPV